MSYSYFWRSDIISLKHGFIFISMMELHLDHFPLEKFLKNIWLLKKSCSKSQNEQLFFSNLYFLRNFSKGNWSKWNLALHIWRKFNIFFFSSLFNFDPFCWGNHTIIFRISNSFFLELINRLYLFTAKMDHFPLKKFLKNIGLLKKSCSFFNFKQLFFSNLMFLRNFSKGKWSKWNLATTLDFPDFYHQVPGLWDYFS